MLQVMAAPFKFRSLQACSMTIPLHRCDCHGSLPNYGSIRLEFQCIFSEIGVVHIRILNCYHLWNTCTEMWKWHWTIQVMYNPYSTCIEEYIPNIWHLIGLYNQEAHWILVITITMETDTMESGNWLMTCDTGITIHDWSIDLYIIKC